MNGGKLAFVLPSLHIVDKKTTNITCIRVFQIIDFLFKATISGVLSVCGIKDAIQVFLPIRLMQKDRP